MYICSNKTKKIMKQQKDTEAYAMHKAEQALKVIAAGAVVLLGVLVYLVYNAL